MRLKDAVRDSTWLDHWRNLAKDKLSRVRSGIVTERTAGLRLEVALVDEIIRLRRKVEELENAVDIVAKLAYKKSTRP